MPLAFPTVNSFFYGAFVWCAGRLTAENGGSRPGQDTGFEDAAVIPADVARTETEHPRYAELAPVMSEVLWAYAAQDRAVGRGLGRTASSEIAVPNMLANLV